MSKQSTYHDVQLFWQAGAKKRFRQERECPQAGSHAKNRRCAPVGGSRRGVGGSNAVIFFTRRRRNGITRPRQTQSPNECHGVIAVSPLLMEDGKVEWRREGNVTWQ